MLLPQVSYEFPYPATATEQEGTDGTIIMPGSSVMLKNIVEDVDTSNVTILKKIIESRTPLYPNMLNLTWHLKAPQGTR
jgi:hypothetical protein